MNPDVIQNLPSFKETGSLEEVRGKNLVSCEYGKGGLSGTAIMSHKLDKSLCVTQSWHTDDYGNSSSTWGTISVDDARSFVGNAI